MSSSSNISQSTYSPSEPETPQNTAQNRIQNFDQSLNHADLGLSIEQSLKSAQKEMHQKRIQSLRKELDYLKSTEWEFDKSHDNINDVDKESFLFDELLHLEAEDASSDNSSPKSDTTLIPRNAVCFQKTGVIKYIEDNYILIDGVHFFDTTNCTLSLNLNDKITYLAYFDKNESLIIVRILENCGSYWGDIDTAEENTFDIREHVIIGEVDHRDNRFVHIKNSSVKINLDNVHATLVPAKGDWLEMTCNIKYEEEKISGVSPEQVLEVISIKPLRSKIMTVVITDWTGEYGICDKQIFFNRECVNIMEPVIGAKALVEVIESSQGTCTWRVIKMKILESNIPKALTHSVDDEEQKSLELEALLKIKVTHPLKFDKINYHQRPKIILTMVNNSDQLYFVNKWIVLSKKKDSQLEIYPILTYPYKLYPGESFNLTITCCPRFYGNSKEQLIIMLKRFQVRRTIEINVIDRFMVAMINENTQKSEQEKIENMKKIRKSAGKVIMRGEKLIRPPNFVPVKLGHFPIPEKVWSAVLGDSDQIAYSSEFDKVISRIEAHIPCLIQPLNITNYIDRWHTLLFMEEVQVSINMRRYDMPKVFLIRCQEYLGVEISGLAERRPSLIRGDSAIVKDIWNSSSSDYEGIIHVIKGDLVLMKFCPQFHESYSGSDVSIEFHFARTVFRRCHQGINLALSNLGPNVLFPSRIMPRPYQLLPEALKEIKWFNQSLNAAQTESVTNILLGECRPMPYCIYGPPGTGKTVTVVETVLQILTHLPDSRILIATPSNSSANLITERLLQYRDAFSTSIVRLLANYVIDSGTIPDAIKPYCATLDIAKEGTTKSRHTIKDGINLNCQKSFIGRHRVTIGTCSNIGNLTTMGFSKGHFTHVIVDEAGQATEPEIMIPLTLIDKESGQIILAGDPMQLGPVVLSKYCVEFGMDESYLSRVLDTFPYHRDYDAYKDGFNSKLVTRLKVNYRSLQEIINLPSDMFYQNSLVSKINREQSWILRMLDVVSELFNLTDTPRSGGIFVHGIRGTNCRAQDSPSWYNPQEASMVALTACKLYRKNINAEDIGIITPYIAQVKYLRILFEAMGLPKPKIGSVEEFQGQERRLIIISTVRSTESLIAEDSKHSLGFVKCPKRLNVALTRAQVAVLLFCDPHLLSADPLWLRIINTAIMENKYVGCDLPLVCQVPYDEIESNSPGTLSIE